MGRGRKWGDGEQVRHDGEYNEDSEPGEWYAVSANWGADGPKLGKKRKKGKKRKNEKEAGTYGVMDLLFKLKEAVEQHLRDAMGQAGEHGGDNKREHRGSRHITGVVDLATPHPLPLEPNRGDLRLAIGC